MPIEKGKSEILFCALYGGVLCKDLCTTVLSGASFPAQLLNGETDLERGNDFFKFTQAFGKAKNSLNVCHCQGQFFNSGSYSKQPK